MMDFRNLLQSTTGLLTLLVLLIVLGMLVITPIWLWKHFRGPAEPVPTQQAGTLTLPPRVIPDRKSVPVLLPQADSLVVDRLPVSNPGQYSGTATITDSLGRGVIIGIRPVRPALFSEFRLLRAQRAELDVLGDAEGFRVTQISQRLPLLQVQGSLGLGMGYDGRPLLIASGSGFRVWFVHLGAFAGLQLGTADVLAGLHGAIHPWGSLRVGAGRDVLKGSWVISLETRF